MTIVVFEDRAVENLHPITIGRAAYAVTCGSWRLIDWLTALASPRHDRLVGLSRPYLAEIQRLDYPELQATARRDEALLLVNARMVPSSTACQTLRKLAEAGRAAAIRDEGALAAAYLPADLTDKSAWDYERLNVWLDSSAAVGLPEAPGASAPLFHWPHDVVRWNMQILGEGLAQRLSSGKHREVADGVFAAEGAVLGQYVVSDTRQGPIVLDEQATVGPYTFLRGPAYIGPKVKIIEHSAIKDFVSIGHTVKLGGEVEASVVEPYSNKQHHGFLGHSYLGSWINLGAGTCNSDLKNTYGHVKMEYRGRSVSTGMQFVGCVMGDYAKSAINTGIFTGKTVGACSMMYGFVTTNVPSFVNYARLFGQVTELTPEVMVSTQQRMFARRNVAQRPADVELLHHMYEATRHERQLAHEPLSL